MKHPILDKLKLTLENLKYLLNHQLPSDSINSDPLDFYAYKFEPLFLCLENLVRTTKSEIQTKKDHNKEMREKIKGRSARVGVEFDDLVIENLALESEYLRRNDEKIFLIENRLGREMEDMIKEINSIKEILKEEITCFEREVSIGQHKEILDIYVKYMEKKKELEKMRVSYVKNIMVAYKALELKSPDEIDAKIQLDHTSVTIDILHQKSCLLNEEIERRKDKVSGLLKQIEELKDILYFYNTSDEEISDSITDNNIEVLETLKTRLIEIEIMHFETIFKETKSKLFDICSVFEMETVDFEKNKENLDLMKKIILELSMKKDKFLEIQAIITKRNDLKTKMIVFEKSASDPKRLFKSSFQLLDEEKFRKTAYPNLLRIEGQLLENITEYEGKFGVFIYKGLDYKDYISHEITNRIINRNVFIMNKNNTPKKQKR